MCEIARGPRFALRLAPACASPTQQPHVTARVVRTRVNWRCESARTTPLPCRNAPTGATVEDAAVAGTHTV